MSKILDLDIIGIDFNVSTNLVGKDGIILRMDKKYPIADYQPHLIVSDNINSLDGKTDLLPVNPFEKKDVIKRKARRGLGLEISISFARKLHGSSIGKWMVEVKSIYKICKSNNCQFILSSGATSINEMVSARSLESILKFIGITPRNYWEDIDEWLYTKNKARWSYAKP